MKNWDLLPPAGDTVYCWHQNEQQHFVTWLKKQQQKNNVRHSSVLAVTSSHFPRKRTSWKHQEKVLDVWRSSSHRWGLYILRLICGYNRSKYCFFSKLAAANHGSLFLMDSIYWMLSYFHRSLSRSFQGAASSGRRLGDFQVSVGLEAGRVPPVLPPEIVRSVAKREADGGEMLESLRHGGPEGRRSGSEEDEYLKSLKTRGKTYFWCVQKLLWWSLFHSWKLDSLLFPVLMLS